MSKFPFGIAFGPKKDDKHIEQLEAKIEELEAALRDIHEFCTCDAHIIAASTLEDE
jgi:hypothetical protein